MAGTLQYGELPYTMQDAYVMRFDRTQQVYTGSVGKIARPQRIEVTPVNDNDEIKSGGARLHSLSVKTSVDLNLKMAGIDYDARTIMTGGVLAETGASPNRIRRFYVAPGGQGLPYFGMICTGSTEGGPLLCWGVVAVMMGTEGGFTMDGETNAYSTSSQEAGAVTVEFSTITLADLFVTYEDPSTFSVPATAAEFLAFFTG